MISLTKNTVTTWDLITATSLVTLCGQRNFAVRWMALKTTRHLVYAPGSFVHHPVAKCELKLELSAGNADIGTKLTIL